jgi:hypothetical protein
LYLSASFVKKGKERERELCYFFRWPFDIQVIWDLRAGDEEKMEKQREKERNTKTGCQT